ncbi:MAG: hypothetical protein ACOC91_00100 [bacterium]
MTAHSGYARDPDGFYIEERRFVEWLADAETFEGAIFDPCAGIGTIPEVFRARGHLVDYADKVDRGFPGTRVKDFLIEPPICADNVVMNPPFDRAEEFIHTALQVATRKVAILAGNNFPHSLGRLARLYRPHRPRIVYYIAPKGSMPPGRLLVEGKIKRRNGRGNFVWIVWDKGYRGPSLSGWLPLAEAGDQRSDVRRGAA